MIKGEQYINPPLFYFDLGHDQCWMSSENLSEGVQFLTRSELSPFLKGGKIKAKD